MRRDEREQLRDLHRLTMTNTTTTPVQVDKPIKGKTWVMTPKGVGLFIAYTNTQLPKVPRCSVQFGYDDELFDQKDVRPATFSEFCFQPTGFGQTPWAAFLAIQGGTIALGVVAFKTWEQGGWIAAAFIAIIDAVLITMTRANFKRKRV